jgi:hypothetical protein
LAQQTLRRKAPPDQTDANLRFTYSASGPKRWAIECLFGDTKSRGLNLEDTRLVTPRKLDLLLGLVALAVAWAAKTAAMLTGRKTPPRKTHGYLAKSWFRIGFDQIRRLLRHDPAAAVEPWRVIASSRVRTPRVV